MSDESRIYVSYNGGSPEHKVDLQEDFMELPSELIPRDETWVHVTPLAFVPDAASISVKPLSTADWELLEIHAAWLEGGGLLGQVSIVYAGQELCLAVNGQDLVRVRVLSLDEPEESAVPCRRLVASTEVVVQPKPRSSQDALSRSPRLRLLPTMGDYSTKMQNLVCDMGVHPLKVPVGTVYTNPETLAGCSFDEGSTVRVCALRRGASSLAEHAVVVVALVQSCSNVPLDHVAMHPLLRIQLRLAPFFDHVQIESLESLEEEVNVSKDLVGRDALTIRLRPVQLIDSSVDSSTPWMYPSAGSVTWRRDTRRITRDAAKLDLRFLMTSWLDIAESRSNVPLQSGSLLDLSCSRDNDFLSNGALYEVVMEASDTTTATPVIHSLFRAGDIPSLISSGNCPLRCTEAPEDDILLNVYPLTPHMSSAEGPEVQSDLMGGISPFDGLLLCGERGSGKTHSSLILAAQQRLSNGRATVYIDCRRMQSSSALRMKDVLTALSAAFKASIDACPSVLILDDLDELAPNVGSSSGDEETSVQQQQPNPTAISQSKLVADHVRNLIDSSIEECGRGGIRYLISCRGADSLAPSIQSSSVFFTLSPVAPVGAADRETLFLAMLRHRMKSMPCIIGTVDMPGFGRKTEGCRPFDLDLLAARVHHNLLTSGVGDGPAIVQSVREALNDLVPLSRQGISVETQSSEVTWEKIGGLFDARKQLADTILNPVKYSRIYQRAPIRLPRGILLYGPPGCGKSFLVPALAKKCELTLVTCRGPELLDKYIGASEAKVRQLFQRAYTAAPSLLFLDEFDALAPRRGSDHTGVTDRVVNQLLTFLDGVEIESGKQVYIVGATSRPDKVDPALLRPGRLEQHVFVGYPRDNAEWNDTFLKIMANHNVDTEVTKSLQSGQLLNSVKKAAPHVMLFSPADLKAVINTAHLQAVHNYIAQTETIDESSSISIGMSHIMASLQSTRPSLSPSDRNMLERIYHIFNGSDTSGDDASARSDVDKLRTALR